MPLMEPLLLGERFPGRPRLNDLAFELARSAAGFRRSLAPSVVRSLSALVRGMNCYYSNLIEGHNTHPVDIERALRNDYSAEPAKRDLQIEAIAHIELQEWIDGGALRGGRAVTSEAILEMHRRFCARLPETLLMVEDSATGERLRVEPGQVRTRDVQVGRHIPVSPGAVPRFLSRFEAVYARLGPSEALIATAAAHHRLLWIHPFLDGNGRVARLMSHAQLLDLLDTGGVWSVARGLARSVQEYKRLLAECDRTRRNDLDGRGTLSEEALGRFTEFFLGVCIDQVKFMETLVQPDRLRTRILLWAEEESRLGLLPASSGLLLEALLYRGDLRRADAASVLGTGDRQARRVVAALLEKGILVSDSPRDSLRLAFPAALASRWMPGLFPDPD